MISTCEGVHKPWWGNIDDGFHGCVHGPWLTNLGLKTIKFPLGLIDHA